ncbi:MAG TPA: hypothetical protein VH206_13820 [Xanthobacteraceae bacterium]|jgi:hypothetical protein|nr:hypothetical protein [Xanthobacteraceae bacterium]
MKIQTKIQAAVALTLFALAYTPSAATAEEGSQSCMQDAFSICGQFIPDRERVAACLISNRAKVSAACRSSLAHFKPAAT